MLHKYSCDNLGQRICRTELVVLLKYEVILILYVLDYEDLCYKLSVLRRLDHPRTSYDKSKNARYPNAARARLTSFV